MNFVTIQPQFLRDLSQYLFMYIWTLVAKYFYNDILIAELNISKSDLEENLLLFIDSEQKKTIFAYRTFYNTATEVLQNNFFLLRQLRW